MNRRELLAGAGTSLLASTLPMSLVKLAFGGTDQADITFAYISDSHIQHISGSRFVYNFDQGLIRAVAEANLMNPRPDFVVYGGDLAQLAKKEELDHGAEIMSALRSKIYWVVGEHDYYLDMGGYWRDLFGAEYYSFDHKGVHFITLNSVLTYEEWINRWPTPEQRMAEMALLDNPQGSPFLVGETQIKWLESDLAKLSDETPIVIFSHSPLQKIFKNWNFWTDDAEQIQSLLKRFHKVNVLYGHVHQIQYNQIGNIAFNSVMATAWPWPYPKTYAQTGATVPVLTVPMNRADPFDERDGTGWQYINVHSGRIDAHYQLPANNGNRIVAFDHQRGIPVDTTYQNQSSQIEAQKHF